MEAATILALFDKTLAVIGLIREGKKNRDEKLDQALLALYAALGETRSYMSGLREGKPRDQARETSIARLWHTASIPLRYIDPDLAKRCFLKGSFWLEPHAWNKEKIKENRIALETVFNATQQLLLGNNEA